MSTPLNSETGRPSLGELIGEISKDLSTLIRQELELAKAELQQSAKSAGTGAGMFAGAGLAGYFVLLFLSIAGWWGLGNALGKAYSALVVAGVWLVIAAVLALVGRSKLKSARGIPQTAQTIKQVPDAVKGDEESNR